MRTHLLRAAVVLPFLSLTMALPAWDPGGVWDGMATSSGPMANLLDPDEIGGPQSRGEGCSGTYTYTSDFPGAFYIDYGDGTILSQYHNGTDHSAVVRMDGPDAFELAYRKNGTLSLLAKVGVVLSGNPCS